MRAQNLSWKRHPSHKSTENSLVSLLLLNLGEYNFLVTAFAQICHRRGLQEMKMIFRQSYPCCKRALSTILAILKNPWMPFKSVADQWMHSSLTDYQIEVLIKLLFAIKWASKRLDIRLKRSLPSTFSNAIGRKSLILDSEGVFDLGIYISLA